MMGVGAVPVVTGKFSMPRRAWRAFWAWCEPEGVSLRLGIGIYMTATGLARILTGNTPNGVGVFSSRVYGLLLVLGAMALFATTQRRWRCAWSGRIACIFCATLYLFIIASLWSAEAWVSIAGASCFVLFLGNEVRIHAC